MTKRKEAKAVWSYIHDGNYRVMVGNLSNIEILNFEDARKRVHDLKRQKYDVSNTPKELRD